MLTTRQQAGFTLMEIVVSTTIFAVVLTLMLVLLNYTIKINRKVEALRQVSQATRNFTEFFVREVRNGSIDYTGSIDTHCPSSYSNTLASATYLALVNRAGDQECFYLVNTNGVGSFWVAKKSVSGATSTEQINPTNVTIDPAKFVLLVRPLTNPQQVAGSNYPGVQPFVTIEMKLSVKLNSAELPTVIPYQTTVSTDNYSISHH